MYQLDSVKYGDISKILLLKYGKKKQMYHAKCSRKLFMQEHNGISYEFETHVCTNLALWLSAAVV